MTRSIFTDMDDKLSSVHRAVEQNAHAINEQTIQLTQQLQNQSTEIQNQTRIMEKKAAEEELQKDYRNQIFRLLSNAKKINVM